MSDFRTRIAAALRTADRRVAGFIGYDEMADAVIAELGPELNRHNTGCVCDECWGADDE